jgi:hypothetical protein
MGSGDHPGKLQQHASLRPLRLGIGPVVAVLGASAPSTSGLNPVASLSAYEDDNRMIPGILN